jgi:Bacterial SH3 domain
MRPLNPPQLATVFSLGLLATVLSSATPTSAQSPKPKPAAPELVLMMNLDRQPGLEQITQTRIDRPAPAPTGQCQPPKGRPKVTKDIFEQFYLSSPDRSRALMFEYRTGTNLATYWVNQIQEARRLNRDETTDLVFHAGDDTSGETVLLLIKPDQVKAVYAGIRGFSRASAKSDKGELFDDQGNQLSTWDPEREVFTGNGIAWTKDRCVPLRRSPDAKGEVIYLLSANEVVKLLPSKGNWQKVNFDGTEGWIDRAQLVTQSPTKVFPLK